jgi:DNA-directed RNA polymerase subunit D
MEKENLMVGVGVGCDKVQVQVIRQTDAEMTFLLKGVRPSFANALRRIMISEVPTMAIEWVDFVKNDSALPDEVIANRLGQVPLTFDQKVYNLPDQCRCKGKGCSRCQVKLILKKKAPGMVYSGDLKSESPDVKPVFDKIPIVELFEEQELEFEAIAQLGFGKDHAKWQGAVVGYKGVPQIKIDAKRCNGCGVCVKRCVKKILTLKNKKVRVTSTLDCNLCLQCVDFCPKKAIEVKASEEDWVFNVESVCGLKVKDVVVAAADILDQKLENFSKNLRRLK